jgi:hypothetical protein
MKFKLKVDNLSFTLEPKYNFANEPALSISITECEVKGEAVALIKCAQEMAKQLIMLTELEDEIKEAA